MEESLWRTLFLTMHRTGSDSTVEHNASLREMQAAYRDAIQRASRLPPPSYSSSSSSSNPPPSVVSDLQLRVAICVHCMQPQPASLQSSQTQPFPFDPSQRSQHQPSYLVDARALVSLVSALNQLEARRRLAADSAKAWLQENHTCLTTLNSRSQSNSTKLLNAQRAAYIRLCALIGASSTRIERRVEYAISSLRKLIFACNLLASPYDPALCHTLINFLFTNPQRDDPSTVVSAIETNGSHQGGDADDTDPSRVSIASKHTLYLRHESLCEIQYTCCEWIVDKDKEDGAFQRYLQELDLKQEMDEVLSYVFNEYDFGKDLKTCMSVLKKYVEHAVGTEPRDQPEKLEKSRKHRQCLPMAPLLTKGKGIMGKENGGRVNSKYFENAMDEAAAPRVVPPGGGSLSGHRKRHNPFI